ncbi:MAG: hypothetical protein IKA32_00975 [Lentisphaeria bacterium]|nr:hypothetical protein [Lentisphaeria bacterium]
MKKLLFLLSFSAILLSGKENVFVLENGRVFHAENSVFKAGVFEGTPKNRGTALVYPVKKGAFPQNISLLKVYGNGFDEKDLSLSLRGKTRVTVQQAKKEKDGSFIFSFAALPEELTQIRIYFNTVNRFSGKKVKLEFKKIQLETPAFFRPDKTVKRQRMFDETVIFPRIQSKYDLIKNYLSSYSAGTGTFVDRPLFFNRELADDPLPEYDKQNSTKSFQKQLETAKMFVNGLGIFYSRRAIRYMNPIRAAEKGKLFNSVFMEATPPGLARHKMMFPAIDQTLASPAVFKHRGALVISSYHGEVFKPEKWKKVLAPYRKRYGKKVLFTVEMRGTGYSMNAHYRKTKGRPSPAFTENVKKKIRAYLDVADGVNFSASNHLIDKRKGFPENVLSIAAYENYIIPVFVSILAEKKYDGKKILGLSAHKGYTQTRHTASNVDDEGTGSMRKSLAAALRANCDFIIMPEWNEINENTHVEPLVSNALTGVRVVNALRGKATADVEKRFPNLILSFRQTNDLAAPVPIELLGLPDKNSPESIVKLHLYSLDGKRVKSFPEAVFSHKKVEEKFFLEPAGNFARHRCLIPELEIVWGAKKMKIRRGLPHIRLFSAPNVNNTYVKIPLRDLPDPGKIAAELTFEKDKIRAKGKAFSLDNIMSVELLGNENVLAALDPRKEYVPPHGMVLLRWMRSTPVVSEFGNDVLKLRAFKGKIQLSTPHIFSLTGMKLKQLSPYEISGKIGGGCCIREFFFFAEPEAELEFTVKKTSVRFKVRDILANGFARYALTHGITQTVEHCTEQIEMPYPIKKQMVDFDFTAPLRADKNTVYTLRIVTEKGRVYRSLPVMRKNASAKMCQLPVWDLLEDKRKVLSVPENMLRNAVFDFDPRYGDVLPVVSGIRSEYAMSGGFDYRSHSAKGWNVLHRPQWEKENGKWLLKFQKGSGLLLCQPLFSRSAFDIELTISCDDTKKQTILDVLGGKLPVKVENGKLHGEITTSCGRKKWQSAATLEKGRFYDLRLVYDLAELVVFLDGRKIASVSATGGFTDGWILCIGGVPEKLPRAVSNVLQKTARSGNTPNSGFRFRGRLKSLRISNYPVENK